MTRDRTALNRELVALAPNLRRYAYALCRSAADADDLLQASLERLLSRPLPEDVMLEKWAIRVCRNIWFDELRARRVRREAAGDLERSHTVAASTEQAAMASIELQRANAAIDKLPEEQRDVLALVAIGGMAYREAAEVLSVPVGTVMSRLARARAALAAQLETAT
jgi:RNA polymerase sigma-70 factor (ECF subfamily)